MIDKAKENVKNIHDRIKNTQEKVHAASEEKRSLTAFFTGAVLYIVLNAIVLGLSFVLSYVTTPQTDRLRFFDSTRVALLFYFFFIILIIITDLLNEDRKRTVTACIGASMIFFIPSWFKNSVFAGTVAVFYFAFSGICLYHGRKKGWLAAFLRTIYIFPIIIMAFFNNGTTIIMKVLIIIYGIICYCLIGRKNILAIENIIVPIIVIAATGPFLAILTVLLDLNHYP